MYPPLPPGEAWGEGEAVQNSDALGSELRFTLALTLPAAVAPRRREGEGTAAGGLRVFEHQIEALRVAAGNGERSRPARRVRFPPQIHSPNRMGPNVRASGHGAFPRLHAAIPVGGSPTGAGESPALPFLKARSKRPTGCDSPGLAAELVLV